MSLVLSAEQRALGASLREFVDRRSPLSRVRIVLEDGREFDADVWRQLVDQLELPSMAIPTEYGGGGFGPTELCLVMRELGRGLVPSPLLAGAVLSAQSLLHCDDQAFRADVLARIASGAIVTLAVEEDGSASWIPAQPATLASADGDGYRLTGRKVAVLNPATAELFIVVAALDGEAALFLVDARSPGIQMPTVVNPDGTRPMGPVEFGETPAQRICGPANPALRVAALYGSLAIAAEQLGAMETCLTTTAEYAKIRFAFGNAIGSYQGVKHPLAETKMALELGYSLLLDAARCADDGSDRFAIAVHAARSYISSAYIEAAYNMVQLHGGIGYTWEHDAHLFYKNAVFSGQLLGGPERHLDELAECILG